MQSWMCLRRGTGGLGRSMVVSLGREKGVREPLEGGRQSMTITGKAEIVSSFGEEIGAVDDHV